MMKVSMRHAKMTPNYNDVCFIVMPFGKRNKTTMERFNKVYSQIIEPAVDDSATNLFCVRADKISRSGHIVGNIITYVDRSPLVIVDLTGKNPNVFYELGIRHSLRHRTILMAAQGTKLPFDTSAERTLFYDNSSKSGRLKARRELAAYVMETVTAVDHEDSPVLRWLGSSPASDVSAAPAVHPEDEQQKDDHTLFIDTYPLFVSQVDNILMSLGFETKRKRIGAFYLYIRQNTQAEIFYLYHDIYFRPQSTEVTSALVSQAAQDEASLKQDNATANSKIIHYLFAKKGYLRDRLALESRLTAEFESVPRSHFIGDVLVWDLEVIKSKNSFVGFDNISR